MGYGNSDIMAGFVWMIVSYLVTFVLGLVVGLFVARAWDRSTVGVYADWCRAQNGAITRIEERGGVAYCSYPLELKH